MCFWVWYCWAKHKNGLFSGALGLTKMNIYLKKVRGPLGEGCGGLVISDPISFADFVHDISGEILVSLSVPQCGVLFNRLSLNVKCTEYRHLLQSPQCPSRPSSGCRTRCCLGIVTKFFTHQLWRLIKMQLRWLFKAVIGKHWSNQCWSLIFFGNFQFKQRTADLLHF